MSLKKLLLTAVIAHTLAYSSVHAFWPFSSRLEKLERHIGEGIAYKNISAQDMKALLDELTYEEHKLLFTSHPRYDYSSWWYFGPAYSPWKLNFRDNNNRFTFLHQAIESNRNDLLPLFVTKYNELLNARDTTYRTPLHLAIVRGDYKAVQFLLSQNANITSRSYLGRTVLHLCCEKLNTEALSLILAHAQKNNSLSHIINATDDNGWTPLHFIICTGEWERSTPSQKITVLLLEAGANVNAQYYDGKTALHYAATLSYEGFIKPLLEYGANLFIQDNNGVTPLECMSAENLIKIHLFLGHLIQEQQETLTNEENDLATN